MGVARIEGSTSTSTTVRNVYQTGGNELFADAITTIIFVGLHDSLGKS